MGVNKRAGADGEARPGEGAPSRQTQGSAGQGSAGQGGAGQGGAGQGIRREPADFSVGAAPLHVVLVEPEIPPNTGSIARLAAGTGAWLHLVEPLGYELDDRHLKRAGLDYWPAVRLSVHPSWSSLEAALPWDRVWLLSSHGELVHTEVAYPDGAVLVFGRESRGLPAELLARRADRAVRIPTLGAIRSLNVAQAAAVVVYEALRQRGYPGMG